MTDKSREPQNQTTQESYMAIGAEIGLPRAEWLLMRSKHLAEVSGELEDSNLQPADFSRSVIVLHRLAFSCVFRDGVARCSGGFWTQVGLSLMG